MIFQSTDVKSLIELFVHWCIFLYFSICFKQCFNNGHIWAHSGNSVFCVWNVYYIVGGLSHVTWSCFSFSFTFWDHDLLIGIWADSYNSLRQSSTHQSRLAGFKHCVLAFKIFWNDLLLSIFSHLIFSLCFGISWFTTCW